MARTIARDHDEKGRLIRDIAAKVFAKEGFDRASMSRVAQVCGISKANIYHYYSSKNDILFDILNTYLSGLRDRICQLDLSGLNPEEQFRKTVVEVLLAYQGADDEHRLQASSIDHLPQAQQATLTGYQRDLLSHTRKLVEAIAPEVFAGDKKKLHATTMSIFGMLNWYYMWNPSADAQARKDYSDLVCCLCLRGIPGL